MKCPDCGIDENTPVTHCTRRHGPFIPSHLKFTGPNITPTVIYHGNIAYLIAGIVIGSIIGSLIGLLL